MEDRLPYKSKYSRFDQIILSLGFTLYPVGLIMALIRVLATHVHHSRKGRNHRLIGWMWVYTFMLFEGFSFLVTDFEDTLQVQEFWEMTWVFGAAFILPAMAFFFFARRADRHFTELLRQYYHLVMNRRIREIDHIAVEVKQNPYHVIRDLDFMIAEHMLPFGRIENDILVLEPAGFHDANEEYEEMYEQGNYEEEDEGDDKSEASERGFRTMECPSCGARMVVYVNEEKECDYCGNVICA